MKYRLVWRFGNNPEVEYYGNWLSIDREVIKGFANYLNTEHPEMHHYVDESEEYAGDSHQMRKT